MTYITYWGGIVFWLVSGLYLWHKYQNRTAHSRVRYFGLHFFNYAWIFSSAFINLIDSTSAAIKQTFTPAHWIIIGLYTVEVINDLITNWKSCGED